MSNKMIKIELPERDYGPRDAVVDSYGDQQVAASYCGMANPPHPINGEWQHGSIIPERNINPEFVIGSDGRSFERRGKSIFYVARQDQVDYLTSQGYKRVYAVGLPIIYVKKLQLKRIPGSLLVMPIHSLPDTKEEWDSDEYANYINSIATKFSTLCLCVHKSCAEKGNWVNAFRGSNIQIVEGAETKDNNSLLRMASLFTQFEYVTSNGFGSHIDYASYFGCKVSVAGPRPRWQRKDYEEITFYANAPVVLDIIEDWHSQNFIAKAYPQFICDPWEAQSHEDWAAWQLGEQCKKSPRDLKELFGWGFSGRIRFYLLVVSQKSSRLARLIRKSAITVRHQGFSAFLNKAVHRLGLTG